MQVIFPDSHGPLLHKKLVFCLNMACNICMSDKDLIKSLGGATKVSDLLGFKKRGGPQRVHNWLTRGIPAKVKLDHQDIFLKRK